MASGNILHPDPDEEYFEMLEGLRVGNHNGTSLTEGKAADNPKISAVMKQGTAGIYEDNRQRRNVIKEAFLAERYPYQFAENPDLLLLHEYCLKESISNLYGLCLTKGRCYRCQKSRMEWVNKPCGHLLWCTACKEWALNVVQSQAEPHTCVVCDRQVHSVDKLSSIWKTEDNAVKVMIEEEVILKNADNCQFNQMSNILMVEKPAADIRGRDESTMLRTRRIRMQDLPSFSVNKISRSRSSNKPDF